MASLGAGQFGRLGRYRLSDNEKFLGGNFAPFIPSISGTGAGTTSATPGNGYTYQTFTSSGTLTVSQPVIADILVVGGGGAGGNIGGGGGGAGGVVHVTNYTLQAGSYVIGVGDGASDYTSPNGNPSYIMTGAGTTLVVAQGGGSGGMPPAYGVTAKPGSSGGGGGGGGATPPPGGNPGGTATQPSVVQGIAAPFYTQYGTAGGTSPTGGPINIGAGAGGGGATVAGGNATNNIAPSNSARAGNGGDGVTIPEFAAPLIGVPSLGPLGGVYGGGGGGGSFFSGSISVLVPGGNPGPGGGGIGARYGPPPGPIFASAGTTNSGGGGGGGNNPQPAGSPGKAGGSGIVIVRYQVTP